MVINSEMQQECGKKGKRVENSLRLKENCSGNRNSQRKMSTLLTLRKKTPTKFERSWSAGRTLLIEAKTQANCDPRTGGKSGKHFLLITARHKKSQRRKWKRRKTRQRQFRLQNCQTKKDFEFQLQRGPGGGGESAEGMLLVSLKNATAEHADVPRPHSEPT